MSLNLLRIVDGYVHRIHLIYSRAEQIGPILLSCYSTPDQITALYQHGSIAPKMCRDPQNMAWDDDDMSGTLDQYLAEQQEIVSRQGHAYRDFVFAHGRWAYPRNEQELLDFLRTGEGECLLTPETFLDNDDAPSMDILEGIFIMTDFGIALIRDANGRDTIVIPGSDELPDVEELSGRNVRAHFLTAFEEKGGTVAIVDQITLL